MIFIDLLLYSEEKIYSFEELLDRHKSNLQYVNHLPDDISCTVIQHAGFSGTRTEKNVSFEVYKSKNKKWSIPLNLFWKIRKKNPEVVLVHSMNFAWQIIFLNAFIRKKTKIIVQNHAEKPSSGIRQFIERYAGRMILAYFMVAKDQSESWIQKNIFRPDQIRELMEGSTGFQRLADRQETENTNWPKFLWVGRLAQNKDPLTILIAFCAYSELNSSAQLTMIYNDAPLETKVREYITLKNLKSVQLLGFVKHEELEKIYNDADYFILGSHYEGSGYALCEAMACGCVPVVTDIPSFSKMTDRGNCGYLFPPGDDFSLFQLMKNLNTTDHKRKQELTLKKFAADLSFKAIAEGLSEIIREKEKV